jgi:hypothetical protein
VLVAVSHADKNPTERPVGKKSGNRLPAVVIGPKGWDQELCDLVCGTERCKGGINPALLCLTEGSIFFLAFDGPGGEPGDEILLQEQKETHDWGNRDHRSSHEQAIVGTIEPF